MTTIRMRHYGRILETMIRRAAEEPNEERRRYLTVLLANKMKQQYLLWNKESVENARILADLSELSGGVLTTDFPEFHLKHGFELVPRDQRQQMQQRKKKK